jgi:hypothetical protein
MLEVVFQRSAEQKKSGYHTDHATTSKERFVATRCGRSFEKYNRSILNDGTSLTK